MMGAVRAWLKVLLLAGILLACAGFGAFLASRSNPFPPGVPDPGAVPSESPSASPIEIEVRSLEMTSRTMHTYRVGGSCTSDWRMGTSVRITASGRVRGRGVARLLPGAACDFPSAQLQARRIAIRILGRHDRDRVVLRFETGGVLPAGSQDLGAFLETIETLRYSVPDGGRATKTKEIDTPGGDVFASTTTLRLRR
jgi:hypothetical protein